jgi:monoamine oxidase
MQCDALIIGGGLSGLRLATLLADSGTDFRLIEARDRLGGRILTQRHGGGYFDMGPAWFWPGQPRMAALIRSLGLIQFEQYAEGILTFEDETGAVQHGRGFASMAGSYRLSGGMDPLINAMAANLPQDRLHLSHPATDLRLCDEHIEVTCGPGEIVLARNVVVALPPRVAATLEYTPELSKAAIDVMQATPTWMGGQAKAVALYDRPFWREAGLSGDAMSRHGPMVEIHDASPAEGGPYALFGFVGVPPAARQDEQALRKAILSQLERLFGAEAGKPAELFLKDWAFDRYTATKADHQPLHHHPRYGRPAALQGLWENRLVFAGTEMALQFGGYLEGALESAEDAYALLETEQR